MSMRKIACLILPFLCAISGCHSKTEAQDQQQQPVNSAPTTANADSAQNNAASSDQKPEAAPLDQETIKKELDKSIAEGNFNKAKQYLAQADQATKDSYLYPALKSKDKDFIQAVLDSGANINIKDNKGNTVWDHLFNYEYKDEGYYRNDLLIAEMADLFVKHGADVNAQVDDIDLIDIIFSYLKSNFKETHREYSKVLNALIIKGANLNKDLATDILYEEFSPEIIDNRDSANPFASISDDDAKKAIDILLKAGADTHAINFVSDRRFVLPISTPDEEIFEMLGMLTFNGDCGRSEPQKKIKNYEVMLIECLNDYYDPDGPDGDHKFCFDDYCWCDTDKNIRWASKGKGLMFCNTNNYYLSIRDSKAGTVSVQYYRTFGYEETEWFGRTIEPTIDSVKMTKVSGKDTLEVTLHKHVVYNRKDDGDDDDMNPVYIDRLILENSELVSAIGK